MRTIEPSRLAKGERIEWTRSFADAPASLYTLQYRFRINGAVGINVTATADGDAHLAEITAAASLTFGTTGKYRWQAWATENADATNTFVVASGILVVEPGFVSSTAAVELRSTAKQILDALDAALLGTATATHLEYEISTPAGTRKVKNLTRDELIKQREYWAKIVGNENAAERVRNGGRFGKQVVINVRER